MQCPGAARGSPRMEIEVHPDDQSVASSAAEMIANEARAAFASRGRFIMAVSGGRTPWLMLRALAHAQLQWEKVHVAQVDERVVEAADPERNLVHLREALVDQIGRASCRERVSIAVGG